MSAKHFTSQQVSIPPPSLSIEGIFDRARLPEIEASEPPEARGLRRDEVRLMVSYKSDNRVIHSQFRALADFLDAGDLLVINTSGTRNAALNVTRTDGTPFVLHLSTQLNNDLWVIELRELAENATKPFYSAKVGEAFALPGNASARLHSRYQGSPRNRLWVAEVEGSGDSAAYLERYGFPIRYGYVRKKWPIDYYQTVYTTEIGSAEMPSAGRAFTPELITQLVARGIRIAPLMLHTGVASLESDEPPYSEFYRISAETAQLVNATHQTERRIIAVGTTVVRALETVADKSGYIQPGEGWTDLMVTPARGMRVVSAMLTGLHEPRSTHLAMLEALTGLAHLQITYAEAIEKKYLWHEFGDLHLILP